MKIAKDFGELEYNCLMSQSFVRVTQDLYEDALGAVPPIYLTNGTFQMGERYFKDLYYTFGKKGKKYYGCLCNKSYSINNFKSI